MPHLSVKRLQDRIADAQYDIESIETQVVKQSESSPSPEQINGLRGLQEMYRERIVSLQKKVASISAQASTTQAAQEDEVVLRKVS